MLEMSLTTTAKNTKIAFRGLIAFMIVYLLGAYFFMPSLKLAYRAIFPPKNPPNPIYGLLDPIQFTPKQVLNTTPPKYTLFTSTGKIPSDLPNKMTVYKYAKPSFSYEAGKRAGRDAADLGFPENALSTNLKGDEYGWMDPPTGASLRIEIDSFELELKTPVYSMAGIYTPGTINRTNAVALAKGTLQKINRFVDPLYAGGTQTVELGMVKNGRIAYTSFQGEAEVARVDFFRKIGDFPMVGPSHKEGLIKIYVGSPRESKDNPQTILKHPYVYYNVREIEAQSAATYPIIPVNTAWEEVAKGNGVISHVKPNDLSPFEDYRPVKLTEILITDIFLAYYDDDEKQDYLQPIYVFEGNYIGTGSEKGNVSVYYPAVSGEWVKGTSTEESTTN